MQAQAVNSVAGTMSYKKFRVDTSMWFMLQQQELTQGLAPARTCVALTVVTYAVDRVGETCSAPN